MFCKISLLIHFILAFLAGMIFSAILQLKPPFVFPTRISANTKELHAWVLVFDKVSFPIHFNFPFLQVNFFHQLTWIYQLQSHFYYPHKSQQGQVLTKFTWIYQPQSLFYCPQESQQGQGLTKYSYLGVFLIFFDFHSSFKIFDFSIYISQAIFWFLVFEFGKISLLN